MSLKHKSKKAMPQPQNHHTSELEDYMYERYFEQLVPIVYAENDCQWHNVYLDVLELLYSFPLFGQLFHD